MYWFIVFILLVILVPFFRFSLAFLILFFVINILLIVGEVFFRSKIRQKQSSTFRFQQHPKTRPPSSKKLSEYDDVQDAEFREEK